MCLVIQNEVEHLCKRLEEWKGKSEPLVINYAFSAVTSDIVSTYLFARPYGCLDVPDFYPAWFVALVFLPGIIACKLTYVVSIGRI